MNDHTTTVCTPNCVLLNMDRGVSSLMSCLCRYAVNSRCALLISTNTKLSCSKILPVHNYLALFRVLTTCMLKTGWWPWVWQMNTRRGTPNYSQMSAGQRQHILSSVGPARKSNLGLLFQTLVCDQLS